MMRALLVVDVQNDYLNEHYLNASIGVYNDIPDFLRNIVNRISQGDDTLVLFFKDFSSVTYPIELHEIMQKYGPAIYKTGFSAFDYIFKEESDLHQMLQEHDIEVVEVCGLYANWCVISTVRDAVKLGYNVVVNPSIVLGEDGRINHDLSGWEDEGVMVIKR